MPFTDDQIKALSSKLNGKHVRVTEREGRLVSYIEGWYAIAEANRVFGYDAWDRQTVSAKCVWEGGEQRRHACSYVARVRIKVRAGEAVVCREGSGFGHAAAATPGEAHENAIKEAETDAMKRALITFGNPFGLALYDRTQTGVRRSKQREKKPILWSVLDHLGRVVSAHENPVEFCGVLKRIISDAELAEQLMNVWQWNQDTVGHLRQNLPELRSDNNRHYSELLSSLYTRRLTEFAEKANSTTELDAHTDGGSQKGHVGNIQAGANNAIVSRQRRSTTSDAKDQQVETARLRQSEAGASEREPGLGQGGSSPAMGHGFWRLGHTLGSVITGAHWEILGDPCEASYSS